MASLGLSCGMQDLFCILWDLFYCDTQVPEHVGSVAAALGFTCSMWNISSLTRGRTHILCTVKVDS